MIYATRAPRVILIRISRRPVHPAGAAAPREVYLCGPTARGRGDAFRAFSVRFSNWSARRCAPRPADDERKLNYGMIYYPAARSERVVGGNADNYEGDRGALSFVRTAEDAYILYPRIILRGN